MTADAGVPAAAEGTTRRLGTAVVGLPLFLAALAVGGPLWRLLLAALVLGAAWEWTRLVRAAGFAASLEVVLPGSLVVFLLAATRSDLLAAGVAAIVAAALTAQLVPPRRRQAIANAAVAVTGALYVALLAALDLLRALPDGLAFALLVVAAVWIGDSAAYFVGRALGRRPLLPAVSPKKTWEGTLAGVIAAAIAGAVVALGFALPPAAGLALGAVSGGTGVIGDLVESALKRSAGVKDAGGLLPGHGGILDRFDALLFAGPAAYALLVWWRP